MAPKHKQQILWVKAVSLVRYVDTDSGRPIMDMNFVGRDANFDAIEEGVKLSYHSFYIKQLKDGALAPMDQQTAQLAGVPFNV